MTVNPNGIIKGFDILEYKPIGVFVVNIIESVKPFSFDYGMKRFDAGIIVRITTMGIASLHLFCDLTPRI